MATKNPTGVGDPLALTVLPEHGKFLRSLFQIARDGIKQELAKYPKQLRDPARLRREEAAYGRLLAALDERVIVPDSDVRAVLCDLMQIVDVDNEYERVIAEHKALHGLLDQLG
jgi:hypothetical protein